MKLFWLAVIAIVIIGGILIFSNSSKNSQTTPVTEKSQSETPSQSSTGESSDHSIATATRGAYLDYSNSVIANTQGTKILFFHAPWCPQCRALDADIKKNTIPSGVTIIKTDYDTNQQLRQKYGVTIQTTLVKVDDDGNLVKKYVAYDEPTLAAVEKNLL